MSASEIFVFVPSYNHAPFVERCLRSIFKQTLKPAKLLVIDDGSGDDSVKIIEKILADCPFPAELVARENRGLCRTLNEGFERSAGEYFAYLGSDDVWLPDFLKRRFELMENNPQAVMCFGNAFLIDENDRILENSVDWRVYRANNDREMLLHGIAPVSSTVFYRRAALEKVRWNENARLEDYELYLKLSAIGEFAFDEEVHAAWRQHGYNTSGDMPLMLREVYAALKRNADVLRLDKTELKQIERTIGFRYAEDFVRRGRRGEAWKLARDNWRGAASAQKAAGVFLRLLAPKSVFRRRKKTLQQAAVERYGKVEI